MSVTRTVVLALLLPLGLGAQQPAKVTSHYDRVRDSTTMELDRIGFGAPIQLYGVPVSPIGLIVTGRTTGQASPIPDTAEFRFVHTSRAFGRGQGFWQFKDNRTLALLVDDSVRFSATAVKYDTTVVIGLAVETVVFDVPRSILKRIAGSRALDGVLGDSTRLAFTAEDLAALHSLFAPLSDKSRP